MKTIARYLLWPLCLAGFALAVVAARFALAYPGANALLLLYLMLLGMVTCLLANPLPRPVPAFLAWPVSAAALAAAALPLAAFVLAPLSLYAPQFIAAAFALVVMAAAVNPRAAGFPSPAIRALPAAAIVLGLGAAVLFVLQPKPLPLSSADNALSVGRILIGARLGDPRKALELGELYWSDQYAPLGLHDEARGVFWLRVAAQAGQTRAALWLGEACLDGKGVPRDDAQAAAWLIQAVRPLRREFAAATAVTLPAFADDAPLLPGEVMLVDESYFRYRAAYDLGLLYRAGRGVKRDDATAIRWLTVVANSGALDLTAPARSQIDAMKRASQPSYLNDSDTRAR